MKELINYPRYIAISWYKVGPHTFCLSLTN